MTEHSSPSRTSREVGPTLFKRVLVGYGRSVGRLKLAPTFAVIAVVLMAPLAFVTANYVDAQNAQVAFSAKERVGVTDIRPMVELLAAVGDARSRAAAGDASGVSTLQAS